MEYKVKKLQQALNKRDLNLALNLVSELAKNKAPVVIHESSPKILPDYTILVYVESFNKSHDIPFIFKIDKSTKLIEVQEELRKVTGLKVDHQHWFHELEKLTKHYEPILNYLNPIPKVIKFNVYVTELAILETSRFIIRKKLPAWVCKKCSKLNNARYSACISCSESRENENT